MKLPLSVIVVAGLLGAIPAASGATIVFDLETVPVTGLSVGGYSSLTLTSGGLTMNLSRASGARFDVVANTGGQAGKPATWGLRSLSPFYDVLAEGDYWIADFSVAITAFSAQGGDYGGDNDIPISLTAYAQSGATGAAIDSDSSSAWTTFSAFPDYVSVGVSGVGINSVAWTSDSSFPLSDTSFPNSLFWDNLTVEVDDSLLHPGGGGGGGGGGNTVPDTGSTLGLVGLGMLGLAGLRKKRR